MHVHLNRSFMHVPTEDCIFIYAYIYPPCYHILGIEYRKNARMADGFFSHSPDNVKKIVAYIRETRPEIVLANAISDRHPDHGRAAKLIADACFYAGLVKIETIWNV